MSNDDHDSNGNNDGASEEKDYEVGFCKPPKATQFQKGQSGNPGGRPKGSKNRMTVLGVLRMAHKDFRDVILDEALKEVEVKENGEIVTTNKLNLVIAQLINKGIRGETRAAKESIRLAEKAILDEHRDVAWFIESERQEREHLKRQWLHIDETANPGFKQMMVIYDRFMDKKSMRFALGEERVPYEDFEPRNEEEWTMLRNHITDLYHEVEEPRPWFELDSDRYRNSQFAKEKRQKLFEENPEIAEKIRQIEAREKQEQDYSDSSD